MSIKFLVFLGGGGILVFFWGGGECRFYFYGRTDFSELAFLNARFDTRMSVFKSYARFRPSKGFAREFVFLGEGS